MISDLNFFNELNFLLKSKQSFVVFKKPNHNKIVCHQGDTFEGKINQMNGKRGFIFMPFNSDNEGFLIVPKTTTETEFHFDFPEERKTNFNFNSFNSKKEDYIKFINNTISEIQNSELEKVVCSTSFNKKINPKSIIPSFRRLIQFNHDAFCYLIYNPKFGTWIGATPEKLINLSNQILTTFALAATKAKINENWKDKEFNEQKIVENQIINNLNKACVDIKKSHLHTIKAGRIYHLKSIIKAKTNKSASDLINLLHPTPAVAGMPTDKAVDYIYKTENYDRLFYSGFLGLFDTNSCDIYVNIRCAKITGDNLTVYVGGGITKDSNSVNEWQEILNKSQTILGALDLG